MKAQTVLTDWACTGCSYGLGIHSVIQLVFHIAAPLLFLAWAGADRVGGLLFTDCDVGSMAFSGLSSAACSLV
jgi:hypothetical protein